MRHSRMHSGPGASGSYHPLPETPLSNPSRALAKRAWRAEMCPGAERMCSLRSRVLEKAALSRRRRAEAKRSMPVKLDLVIPPVMVLV